MSDTLKNLYLAVVNKKAAPMDSSYTSYLLQRGEDKILTKIGEECTETILAVKNNSQADIVYEISDLLYHLTVLMVEKEIPPEAVLNELERRTVKINSCKAGEETLAGK